MQNTRFSINKTLNISGRLLTLETPRVMGILNVTPDSFYDGGRFGSDALILRQAEKMLTEGAAIIDVGGYSTRPGAGEVDEREEIARVLPAIRSIAKHFPQTIISVDTFRSEVALRAVQEGAGMINDISGGAFDKQMFDTVARMQVPYVLMHMRGTPQTMNQLTHYNNLIKDVIDYFHTKMFLLTQAGVKDIIIDPGFGFAKTRDQNFLLLKHLGDLAICGKPVLAGLSRKSMVWKTLNVTLAEALNGTSALNAIALLHGADLLRVHDVKACMEVVKLFTALRESTGVQNGIIEDQ